MSDIKITSSLDILNSAPGKLREISNLSTQVSRALDAVTSQQKYGSRAELDATGLSRRFDNAQAIILRAEANKTTVHITSEKLRAQQQALTDINNVMVRFHQEYSQSTGSAGTTAEKADKALAGIERIMRTKNQAGEYIFGGNDPFTDPLSVIDPNTNQRVSVSLKDLSNVTNGNVFVNNYSDASADKTIVTASSKHEIKQGFLYPGMDSMVKTIGYLNMIKSGTADVNDVSIAQENQRLARSETRVLVDLEIRMVEEARTVNLADIKEASEVLDNFKGDLVELSARAKDLLQSFAASITIATAGDKAFDTLLQNSRV